MICQSEMREDPCVLYCYSMRCVSVGGADWKRPMCSDSVSLTYLASDIALEFSSFLNANEEYQFLGALLRQLTRHGSIIAENFI